MAELTPDQEWLRRHEEQAKGVGEFVGVGRTPTAEDILMKSTIAGPSGIGLAGMAPSAIPIPRAPAGAFAKEPSGVTRVIPSETPGPPAEFKHGPGTESAAVFAATGEAKEHPLAKYKDEYEWLATLSDEGFKKFVDKHGNDVPGIGYISGQGPGKIERIIERPRPDQGGVGPMSVKEFEVRTRANELAEARKSREQMAADTREGNAWNRYYVNTAHWEEGQRKVAKDFNDRLQIMAPAMAIMGEDGKPTKNLDVGLLDMLDRGEKIPPALYDAPKALWDRREQWVTQQFASNKKPYIHGDINKPGTDTYEIRQRALKSYRDSMLGVAKK